MNSVHSLHVRFDFYFVLFKSIDFFPSRFGDLLDLAKSSCGLKFGQFGAFARGALLRLVKLFYELLGTSSLQYIRLYEVFMYALCVIFVLCVRGAFRAFVSL